MIPKNLVCIVAALGKLLFNCGLFELLSRSWIFELEPNDAKRIKLCNKLWGKRREGLKKLIGEKLNVTDLKPKFIQVIEDTDELMNFRNSVAHASLVENNDEAIVIFDSRMEQESEIGRKISLGEINDKINQCADLFDKWNRLWNEYKMQSVGE